MFNHVSTYCYSLANRQGLLCYKMQTQSIQQQVHGCSNILVQSCYFTILLQHVLSCINTLSIYHDGSNAVQVCWFIKPWTVCPNMHEFNKPVHNTVQVGSTMFKLASSTMFKLFVFTCIDRVRSLACDEYIISILFS